MCVVPTSSRVPTVKSDQLEDLDSVLELRQINTVHMWLKLSFGKVT